MREKIRQEIEETHQEFHALLASIPEEAFSLPSDNPAWNVGEVLYHLSIAPRFLERDVKMITGQSWFYRALIKLVPKTLFDWLNKVLTRYGARNISHQFLAQEYDKAHQSVLQVLQNVPDADFAKKLQYPDWDPLLTGEVTLSRLFHYIKIHFDSHASQIRQIVAQMDREKE